MTEKRFKWEDVCHWQVPAFLEVMNGLDKKNQQLKEKNEELKQDIEYLEEKIKENEWHWNTIDEDRDVWHYKCTEAEKRVKELKTENEQLKQEKEFWKGDSCKCSNYLSILSMDCQIVQEAIYDLKNVIDVDTEAFKLLDELDDKFDELNQHRIRCK